MPSQVIPTELTAEDAWLLELPQLIWKHSSLCVEGDLNAMSLKDLQGLYFFLLKVDAHERKKK